MATLTRMALQLESKKREASKLRRKGERELAKARQIYRRSSSGLAAAERRITDAREELTDISTTLAQKLAQRESIQRLIAAAKERLGHEKESKERVEQELEFADSDEQRQAGQERLRSIASRIDELSAEIRERNKMIRKLAGSIEQYESSKSKVSGRIKKQSRSKPGFRDLIKSSQKTTEKLARQVLTRTKQEESAKDTLKKIQKKLAEKRPATKRRAKTKTRRTAVKKAQRKASKKTVKKTRRTVTKKTGRKTSKKTVKRTSKAAVKKTKRRAPSTAKKTKTARKKTPKKAVRKTTRKQRR